MQSQMQLVQAIQELVSPLTYRTSLPRIAEEDLWDCWEIWKCHDDEQNQSTQAINQNSNLMKTLTRPVKSTLNKLDLINRYRLPYGKRLTAAWKQMRNERADDENAVKTIWEWLTWELCGEWAASRTGLSILRGSDGEPWNTEKLTHH